VVNSQEVTSMLKSLFGPQRNDPFLDRNRHLDIRFALMILFALAFIIPSPASATVSVTTFAPGSEAAAIAGYTIENFEDVYLVSGVSITLSVWRNGSNTVTANPPVT
jgi:hypothetical protein